MKHLPRLFVLLAAAVLFTACDAFRSVSGPGSTSLGKPYELIIVSGPQEWNGPVGDTLRALFRAPVAYINQDEPRFDVLRVLPRGFTNMVTKHRNILRVLVDPSADKAAALVQYDVRVQPQVEVTLQGPSQEAVLAYLDAHGSELVYLFEMAERDRAVNYAARFNEQHIEEVIRQTFGVEMTVPKGYVLAKQEPDFIWCRYEYPTASQGFCIYSYPYEGRGSLTPASLLAARNRFMRRIPGPSDGSYMTTSEAFEPDVQPFRLEGRAWIEMRGFWDVAGDFMGGPFVSFTTVDTATNRVFTLDGYVYSPKLDKRNFLRGVEHLLYMVHFPAAPQPTE